jgi:hypothetical protein
MGARHREEEPMNVREAWRPHRSFTRRGHEHARRRAQVPIHVLVYGSNCICHICKRHSGSGRAAG